jgi:serine/threonine protein kinase
MKKLEKTYEYIKRLGGGEYSNIYLVKHRTSGKEHALKILDYHFLLQKLEKANHAESKNKFNEIKERFIVEAKLYEKIDHPNIVKIHDAGVASAEEEDIEIPYFIMSYVRGSSLDKVIKNEAPFEMDRILRISRDVLSAIEIIHQNHIIHRDLKPSNIMIEEETGKAVLIDFGIAKDVLRGPKITTTGALLGTPDYMAPEQFKDSSKVGVKIDIYSFGVVLFEMLMGEPPFKGHFLELMNAHCKQPIPNVTKKNSDDPIGIQEVIEKAMAKKSNERYSSAKEFLDALAHIKYGDTAKAIRKSKAKNKRRLVAAIAVLIVLLVVGSALFLHQRQVKNERINGTKDIDRLLVKLDLKGYLGFIKKYPLSIHIPDLKNKLREKDKNLPPEKYWTHSIKRNKKSYYELTFGNEYNGHVMIYIPEKNFWIDKYEVSYHQLRKFFKEKKNTTLPIKGNTIIKEGDEYPFVAAPELAREYCETYGFRLPVETEWEYAANGGQNIDYPWGNQLPDAESVYRANFYSKTEGEEKDGFEGTAPVKSFEKFSSPFGVVNMAGNVYEWVQEKNIIKGGCFLSKETDLKITAKADGTGTKRGFRCIKTEAPEKSLR